jgi:hypothetical protein
MARHPDALNRFVTEVLAALEARGFPIAARRLAEVQGGASATGSEWLGELGAAVKAIRNQRGLPVDVKDKLEAIAQEARARHELSALG